MNILTDELPTKIKVNNKIYDINYDYRTIILTLQAFEDPELTKIEKLSIMVQNIYKDEIPDEDFEEACKKACKFIDLGQEDDEKRKSSQRIFSFQKDASYIFSGINSTHHIDIEEKSDLHWWKFMSYFMDMSPDCMFGEITYYRKRKADGKLTKEEKKTYENIKELLDLDYVKPQSEARKKFLEEFNKNYNK